jgi:hypothetical protein
MENLAKEGQYYSETKHNDLSEKKRKHIKITVKTAIIAYGFVMALVFCGLISTQVGQAIQRSDEINYNQNNYGEKIALPLPPPPSPDDIGTDEFDEQEELYNPASLQYLNRAERQRGIMLQFETETLERDRRRQEYINRYSYNFDLATYDALWEAAKNAENPATEMHELIAATSIARIFNVPVDEARANSEYYRNLLYPNVERYEFPKTWAEKIVDNNFWK